MSGNVCVTDWLELYYNLYQLIQVYVNSKVNSYSVNINQAFDMI